MFPSYILLFLLVIFNKIHCIPVSSVICLVFIIPSQALEEREEFVLDKAELEDLINRILVAQRSHLPKDLWKRNVPPPEA